MTHRNGTLKFFRNFELGFKNLHLLVPEHFLSCIVLGNFIQTSLSNYALRVQLEVLFNTRE
jgi:hypothetical protein